MKNQTPANPNQTAMPFGRVNYILILCGLVAIILGFILLSGGGSEDPATEFNYAMFNARRLYVAPILLLVGFLFGLFAIMYRPKNARQHSDNDPKNN